MQMGSVRQILLRYSYYRKSALDVFGLLQIAQFLCIVFFFFLRFTQKMKGCWRWAWQQCQIRFRYVKAIWGFVRCSVIFTGYILGTVFFSFFVRVFVPKIKSNRMLNLTLHLRSM